MKEKLQVYTIINNPIFAEGIENLMLNKIFLEVDVVRKKSLQDLIAENDFGTQKDQSTILIYDVVKFCTKDFNLLSNLIATHPNFKVLLITTNIKTDDLKHLFEMGVSGIINKNILPEQFINYVVKILKGTKVLSPEYKELIVEMFFETVTNHDVVVENTNKEKLKITDTVPFFDELTNREKEILGYICDGKSTREISEDLFISLHTVETHRRKILKKLGVKNTAAMVKAAIVNDLYAL